ncbi:MAG: WxcM-like domain-containing protein [Bacteroidales bacterium]|nr:WxcM-like domain-containing protein [Bacteroidales bacterium]MBQ7819099.1 WxcM-like domain-containing protein [Bacteroidales bacterium]
MALSDAKIVMLPKEEDFRGNLSVIEEFTHIPFAIERAYWIYDVPGGEKRYGHAFKEQHEFIVALSGSFDIILNDGKEEKVFSLNRSYQGVYVPNKIWRKIENFSTNAVALVLSSTHYSSEDYIEDFNEYLQYINSNE